MTATFTFQSQSRNECLLFAVRPDKIMVYKLSLHAAMMSLAPGVAGALIDSSTVVNTLNGAITNRATLAMDPLTDQIVAQPESTLNGWLPPSVRSDIAMTVNGGYGYVEADFQVFADSYWNLSLYRETLRDRLTFLDPVHLPPTAIPTASAV
ncbi:MAG: hypothetical protein H7338_11570 [Candidatus Sericytochromatia bacterium]|nr:hypothetical protein [Candidatus Sericytochromatia bacterium]